MVEKHTGIFKTTARRLRMISDMFPFDLLRSPNSNVMRYQDLSASVSREAVPLSPTDSRDPVHSKGWSVVSLCARRKEEIPDSEEPIARTVLETNASGG